MTLITLCLVVLACAAVTNVTLAWMDLRERRAARAVAEGVAQNLTDFKRMIGGQERLIEDARRELDALHRAGAHLPGPFDLPGTEPH